MPSLLIPEWLSSVLALLGILALCFGPSILVARFEKRMLWPYTPIEEPAQSKLPESTYNDNPYAAPLAAVDGAAIKPTDFAARENHAASLAGFEAVGSFNHGKGGIYRVRYDFWRSMEGNILALVGGGTLAGIPVLNTWLFTRLSDGRCLITLGDQKASEIDLGALSVEALVAGGDFEELLDWHRRRIAASPESVVPYSEIDPLGDHFDFRRRRTDRLEERGYAGYLDPERTVWRYTFKGALAFAFRGITQGMRRVFLPDKFLERFRLRNPA